MHRLLCLYLHSSQVNEAWRTFEGAKNITGEGNLQKTHAPVLRSYGSHIGMRMAAVTGGRRYVQTPKGEKRAWGQQMNIGVGRLTTDDIFFLTSVRSHSPARILFDI